MPILTNPSTGGRYDAGDRPDHVKALARSGWLVDDDQSPIRPAEEPAPEQAPVVETPTESAPAATATRTSKNKEN